jgi:hypothetical protein
MSLLQKYEPFLRFISSATTPPKQRTEVIRRATDNQVDAICECAYNVLHNAVPVTPSHKKKLKRFKNKIYTLADKKVPISKRRRQLQQSGGFLPALIAPVVSALLGGLIDHIVSK